MKKKGFTLVELLGVIVVLVIIALIAVPTIIGIIDKSRKSSLQNSGYGLVEAGTLYYAYYQNSKTIRFDIKNNNITTKDGKDLTYKGNIKEGTVLINKKGKTTICINDGKYAAYKNFEDNKVTIVDNKTCTIPENSNIVYLDNESTIDTNIEDLIKRIEELEKNKANTNDMVNLINELNTKNNYLTSEINTMKSSIMTLDKIYPVGSIYISTNDINPSNFLGGTWEKYAGGRTLIGEGSGIDSNNVSSTFLLNKMGGEYSHKLSIDEIPSHTHSLVLNGENAYFAYGDQNFTPYSGRGASSTEGKISTPTGGSQYHNNIQPYIVVSIWKRVS